MPGLPLAIQPQFPNHFMRPMPRLPHAVTPSGSFGKATAKVAGAGRHGDSTLVHMRPAEIAGLERMTGRKMTTNPQTGLPEAFGLGDVLGIAGGLAGMFLAPELMPALSPALGGALGAGLGETAGTGDITKGLSAGLMGYGLGGAADMLLPGTFAGSAAAAPAAEAATMAPTSSTLAANSIPASSFSSGIDPSTLTAAGPTSYGSMQGLQQAAQGLPGGATPGLGGGINGDSLYDTFVRNGMKTSLPIAAGAYGLSGGMGGSGITQPQTSGNPTYSTNIRYKNRTMTPAPSTWDPTNQGAWQYFSPAWGYASGGGIDSEADTDSMTTDDSPQTHIDPITGQMTMNLAAAEKKLQDDNDRKAAGIGLGTFSNEPMWYADPQSGATRRLPPITPDVQMAAGGPTPGAGMMGGMGGPISGPGGGLDDAIPAIIDGRQPAALSSGEHVIPAHAVSALGNGSSEEGHRQLSGMINKVLKKKYGTMNRKPNPINAKKMLAPLGGGMAGNNANRVGGLGSFE